MNQFSHLNFIQKLVGKPILYGGGRDHPKSKANKRNRAQHSNLLSNQTSKIKSNWKDNLSHRKGLSHIDEGIIPIYLQLNPSIVNAVDFELDKFGIEIISEESDGFIIGASLDNFRSLEEKIKDFISVTPGTAKIADLWNIIEGKNEEWKPKHILSKELFDQWAHIQDEEIYNIEVSVAFDKPIGEEPDPSKRGGKKRLEEYRKQQLEREDDLIERQNHFEKFIRHYGEITSSLIDLGDSFGCELKISGKGLKDLVVNYQFVFDVTEIEEIGGIEGTETKSQDFELDILPPENNAPEIGVIDSGIMENHRYLELAVNSAYSKSYVNNDTSTSDKVQGGGHGTKVAGAILYPNGISNLESPYQLPCYVRNIRVLNKDNSLVNNYPAELMERIVNEHKECQVFNLSINSKAPFRLKHMSSWAAMIDSLIHKNNVLFVISSGNIRPEDVKYYLEEGIEYPRFLLEPYCRLANPAQSSFGLTVGSINPEDFEDQFWKALGTKNNISPFSRIGTGIWRQIKPDVVEAGGGFLASKNGTPSIKVNQFTSPELIRSTLNGGNALGRDAVGTSFSTPRVAYIVAQLKKLYPNESVNLLRALVIQGARLPLDFFINPTLQSLRFFGYGIPSLERVTTNTEQRITFYNTGNLKTEEAHVYSLKMPQELADQGDEFNFLIEVTLCYTAKVRRTRQRTKSYLATWLDWTTSKLDEDFEVFSRRCIRDENSQIDDANSNDANETIKWKLRERNDWGKVKGINRNNSTAQKDWTILKSYQLPKEICFAVRAHKGWDKNKEEVPYALVVSIEILDANIPIYQQIKIENEIEIPIQN